MHQKVSNLINLNDLRWLRKTSSDENPKQATKFLEDTYEECKQINEDVKSLKEQLRKNEKQLHEAEMNILQCEMNVMTNIEKKEKLLRTQAPEIDKKMAELEVED